MKHYEADIPPAQSMSPIGKKQWFARARAKEIGPGRTNHFIRIPGEWHGQTREEAEAKARRAAEEWIAHHSEQP